jgi:energy-coupling factor transporter transmembrane protein EcfT
MIFTIIAGLFFVGSVFVFIKKRWLNFYFRIAYLLSTIIICFTLYMFGKEVKTVQKIDGSGRRNLFVLADVSASMKIDYNLFKDKISKAFSDYNVHVLSFSNKIGGNMNAPQSYIVSSIDSALSYINGNFATEEVAGLVILTDGNETQDMSLLTEPIKNKNEFPVNVIYMNPDFVKSGYDRSVNFISAPRFVPRYKKQKIVFGIYVSDKSLLVFLQN